MKKLFTLAALVTVASFITIIGTRSPGNSNEQAEPNDVNQVLQPAEVTGADFPAPPPPEPVVSAAPLPSGTNELWLNQLYQSPSLVERLKAARQIAAQGNQSAFLELATFVAAAEATGDDALVDVAVQVAAVLGQMRGTEIQTIATELSYSPSPLVAGAAVDAAIAADSSALPQSFDSGLAPNPADQGALDAFVQQLLEYDGTHAPEPQAVDPINK